MIEEKIKYRKATAEDKPFMTQMLLEAAKASLCHIEPDRLSDYPDTEAYIKDFPGDKEVGVIAETETGEPVGAAGITNLPFQSHVVKYPMPELTVSVSPAYRRQGIASELLEYLYKWAAEEGIHEISLGVFHQNRAAINLYLKHDWVIDGTINNDEYVMMSRRLP